MPLSVAPTSAYHRTIYPEITKNQPVPLPSYQLALRDNDKRDVHELITMLSTTSLFSLDQNKIKRLGVKLDQLHPLTVWKHIANDDHLSRSIKKINMRFVWPRMKVGYAKSFMKHFDQHNLSPAAYQDFTAVLSANHPFKCKMPATDAEWQKLLDTFVK